SYSSSGEKAADQIVNIFTFGIGSIIQGFVELGKAQQLNANPILALATLGSGLVSACTSIFIAIAIAALVATIALGAAWGFTFSSGIMSLVMVLMSLFGPLLVALIVAGLTMAFYIPIIPLIIFTFGVIGWFISV